VKERYMHTISTNNSSTEDSSKDVELVCDSKDIELYKS
jgi:hypothetical protein